ncbi:phosphopantetheine-binding protein [Lentzea sp. NPDC004789]
MSTKELEATIVEAFRDALQKPALSVEDDFFAVGGDSLLAVEVSYTISQSLGKEIDPLILFVYPTASSCADALTEESANS